MNRLLELRDPVWIELSSSIDSTRVTEIPRTGKLTGFEGGITSVVCNAQLVPIVHQVLCRNWG